MINPENGLDNHSKINCHEITQVNPHLPLCDSGQDDSPLHSSEDSLEGSKESTNSCKKPNKKLKVRSVSENNEGFGHHKGILKYGGSTRLRSLSESCADSYCFSLSNNGEPNIDEESDEELDEDGDGPGSHKMKKTEKTVRFSETVQRQLFRSNSSILGQRLKNQRKQRKKKKSSNQKTTVGRSSAANDGTFSSSTESESAFTSAQNELSDALDMVTLSCDSGIEIDSEDPSGDGSFVAQQINYGGQLGKKKEKKQKRGKNATQERNTNRRVSESDLMFEIDL